MSGLSFLVFCLGTLFGAGAFFRKGGEMLATYVLFPILFVTLIMGMKTENTELFFSQINRSAIFGALLGALLLVSYHVLQIRQAGGLSLSAFAPNARFNFKTLWASGKHRGQAFGARARSASTVYYQTAVKLGAITTMIDKTRAADGFYSLKTTFNLSMGTCPEALDIFNTQIRHPQRLRAILKPFITQYGRGSAIAETLIYGMCKVALTDGHVGIAEIRLIDRAADILGIHAFDTRRVIASAGVDIESEFSTGRSGGASWQNRNTGSGNRSSGGAHQARSAPSERDAHLATLGLSAGATISDAKTAWRKLAVKYHPDKLVSQNLPEDEMAKAEAMMQAINAAYDWLKETPQ